MEGVKYIHLDRESLPNTKVGHMLVVGELDAISENKILRYYTEFYPRLYYLTSNVSEIAKLHIFNEVFIHSSMSQLRSIQQVVGNHVHYVPNPIYTLPRRTRDSINVDDLGIIIDNFNDHVIQQLQPYLTYNISLGLINDACAEEVCKYVDNMGYPIDVRVIAHLDDFYKHMLHVGRLHNLTNEEYIEDVCILCDIPYEQSDLHVWKKHRDMVLINNTFMDLRRILHVIANSDGNTLTPYGKYICHYNEHYRHELSNDPYVDCIVQHGYSCQPPRLSSQGRYAHISEPGGVPIISNLYKMFVTHEKGYLFHAEIPIDYPWIAELDITKQQLAEVCRSIWFQRSLKTCLGWLVYNDEDIVLFGRSYPTYRTHYPELLSLHPISVSSTIKCVVESGTNPYMFYRLSLDNTGYNKHVYGIKDHSNVTIGQGNDVWSLKCYEYFSRTYPNHDFNAHPITYNANKPTSTYPNDPQQQNIYWDLVRSIKSVTIDEHPNAEIYFLYIEDATCSKTLSHCLRWHIPIIVNKCPLSVTYLGDNYPLFYEQPYDVYGLLVSKDSIMSARLYLRERHLINDVSVILTEIQ